MVSVKRRFIHIILFALAFALLANCSSDSLDKEEVVSVKNHLAGSLSPYLLQHAENPVDWYPWGEEAFQKARSEDKPIFLSIGYSACHWCHVMAHESFENDSIAAFLNDNFVSIKVDREERPDVDDIYMSAVQMFTGSGGWPLTVFLTTDLKPFYGGTYFPPVKRYGRPGFLELIQEVSKAFQTQRDRIENSAEQITSQLKTVSSSDSGSGAYDRAMIANAIIYLSQSYETNYGGFGSAPKFPPTGQLDLLMRTYSRKQDPQLLNMVEHTLTKMAEGGIFDQIGGGFHRYSVDEEWLTPHFEKMLYDNALLTVNYLDLYLITKNEFYADVARSTMDWVLREMQDSGGGFYSSMDADSDGEEGLFYIWKSEELADLLGNDVEIMADVYNMTPQGNFEDKTNILTRHQALAVLAEKHNLTIQELQAKIKQNRAKMLKSRSERIWPGKDDKVLTDWNSLMITAFARGYRVLGDNRYLEAANNCADFILETMQHDGKLFHSYREGEADIAGMLDDYAYLSEALLELYQAGFNEKYFIQGVKTANRMIELFWDSEQGGFYQVNEGREDLLYRIKQGYDSATPSANAIAARVLFTIFQLNEDENFRKFAYETVRHYAGQATQHPAAFFRLIALVDEMTSPMKQIAIIRPTKTIGEDKMLQAVNGHYLPGTVIASKTEQQISSLAFLADRPIVEGISSAYYCVNFSCKLPTNDVNVLNDLLEDNVK